MDQMHTIEVGGLIIQEPSTVLTNLVMAVVAFICWRKLKSKSDSNHLKLFAQLFFLFLTLSTVFGGVIGHGLMYYTGMWGKIPGWYLGMASIAMIERVAIRQAGYFLTEKQKLYLNLFNYLEIAFFMSMSIIKLNFLYVELHAVYGLFVIVFFFELFYYFKTKDPACKPIFTATFFGVLAMLCHAFKISPNFYFNYNDLSHIFMSIAIVYYYKGFKSLSDKGHRYVQIKSEALK